MSVNPFLLKCQVASGLYLVGDSNNVQRTINILNEGLPPGYTASADKYGQVSIAVNPDEVVDNPTSQQQAVLNYVSKITASSTPVVISVVAGDPDVFVGHFYREAIDIEDIEALGPFSPGVTSVSALVHELEEQYQKQTQGISTWPPAHFGFAIPAENAVAGASRLTGSDYTDRGHYYLEVPYAYDSGATAITTIKIDRHGTIVDVSKELIPPGR